MNPWLRPPTVEATHIDRFVAQLSDSDEPNEMPLRLWGGVFEGRRLIVDRTPTADDIAAHFDW